MIRIYVTIIYIAFVLGMGGDMIFDCIRTVLPFVLNPVLVLIFLLGFPYFLPPQELTLGLFEKTDGNDSDTTDGGTEFLLPQHQVY